MGFGSINVEKPLDIQMAIMRRQLDMSLEFLRKVRAGHIHF